MLSNPRIKLQNDMAIRTTLTVFEAEDVNVLARHPSSAQDDPESSLTVLMFDGTGNEEEGEHQGVHDEHLPTVTSLPPREKVQMFEQDFSYDDLRQARREQFIKERAIHWARRGRMFKMTREALGLSVATIAESLQISPSSISKFEEGKPDRRAAQIESG